MGGLYVLSQAVIDFLLNREHNVREVTFNLFKFMYNQECTDSKSCTNTILQIKTLSIKYFYLISRSAVFVLFWVLSWLLYSIFILGPYFHLFLLSMSKDVTIHSTHNDSHDWVQDLFSC